MSNQVKSKQAFSKVVQVLATWTTLEKACHGQGGGQKVSRASS